MRALFFLFLVVAELLVTNVFAQQVRVITCTEQDWAGGIAGHSGANYTFTIEFTGYTQEPQPLAIWIGSDVFQLTTGDSTTLGNTSIQQLAKGKKMRVKITVGTFHDEYADRYELLWGGQQKKEPPKPPIAFNGKALLVYAYRGQTKYLEIKKIMDMLPRMDLP